MKLLSFNINDCVRVKLTEKGKKMLAEHCGGEIPDWYDTYYKYDEWYQFQLWDLMNIFGSHIHMGSDNPFETNILIEVEE
jgi:hypothetical protein